MTLHWSPQQENAIAKIGAWYRSSASDQVMFLGGYAGTGKTTLTRHLVEEMGAKPCYGAYTGKAAQVMRNSGCDEAGTLHSKVYKFRETGGRFVKTINRGKDSPIREADIVVVDECSMVDGDLGGDILSFGKPVLVLGDPMQLPPVKGGGFFTGRDPDIMLTEIHRQAEGDPIIRLATDVREGRGITFGTYGKSAVVTGQEFKAGYDIEAFDQILVGRHPTRIKFNTRFRQIKDYAASFPQPGERLVCLANDRDKQIFNGGMFEVIDSRFMSEDRGIAMSVKSEDDPSRGEIKVFTREEFFTGARMPDRSELRGTQQFAFGYTLTVHKAQGSQWSRVVLVDEAFGTEEDRIRWLYTGITRAQEQIVIIRKGAKS